MSFAENLREIRQAKGMSQAEFTLYLNKLGVNITQPTIANYELSRRMPHSKTLFALSSALGVDADELFNGKQRGKK